MLKPQDGSGGGHLLAKEKGQNCYAIFPNHQRPLFAKFTINKKKRHLSPKANITVMSGVLPDITRTGLANPHASPVLP